MHIRKQSGIIKYGKRLKKKVAFQGGGSIQGGTQAYDWRDDPYEKFLATAKLQKESAKYQGKGRRSGNSINNIKNSSFQSITGGLSGSMKAANDLFDAEKKNYFDNLRTNGADWSGTVDGIEAYQNVVAYGVKLTNAVKAEKSAFDKASSAMKNEDPQALAINGSNVMVYKKINGKDGDGKDTESIEADLVSVLDYANNSGTMQAMTVSDFMEWKSTKDTSGRVDLISMFMSNGAVSMNTMAETYIDPVEFNVRNDAVNDVIVNVMTEDTMSRKDVENAIYDMIEGGAGITGVPDKVLNKYSNLPAIKTLIQELYQTAVNNSDSDRLNSTLVSEVLKSSLHRRKIGAIKGKDTDETKELQATYIREQGMLIVAGRALYKEKFKYKSENNPNALAGGKAAKGSKDADVVTQQISNMLSGDRSEEFVFGDVTKDDRVASFKTPGIRDAFNVKTMLNVTTTLDGVTDTKILEENFVGTNTWLNDNVDLTEMYLQDGRQLSDKDIAGNARSAKQLASKGLLIDPFRTVDLVYLPIDESGNVMIDLFTSLSKYKIKARESFKAFYNSKNPTSKIVNASELLPNNSDQKKIDEYQAYTDWIKSGSNVKAMATQLVNGDITQEEYDSAKAASIVIANNLVGVKDAMKGRNIVLKPFAKVPTIYNNDKGWFSNKDIAEKINKDKVRDHNNLDPLTLAKRDSTAETSKYVNDNDIDYLNFRSDKNWSFDIYVKLKDGYESSMNNGSNNKQAKQASRISSLITGVINKKTTINSSPTAEDIVVLLL